MFLCAKTCTATSCLNVGCAFLHEKSYRRVGFFSVHGRSRTSFPGAFVCGSHNGKGVFLVVAQVRFLVKPTNFSGLLVQMAADSLVLVSSGAVADASYLASALS